MNVSLGSQKGVNFFFSSRRRHTRFDCDWSSDVCSSDLERARGSPRAPPTAPSGPMALSVVREEIRVHAQAAVTLEVKSTPAGVLLRADEEIGRASCRERVQISEVAVSLTKKIDKAVYAL